MPTRLLMAIAFTCLALAACGDSDSTGAASGDASIPIDEWVADFDRLCVQTGQKLSDSTLTETEFVEASNEAIAQMRAIGTPATGADEAGVLLEVIDAQTNDTTLTDEQISDLDNQFLAAAQTLGISDECLGGASG